VATAQRVGRTIVHLAFPNARGRHFRCDPSFPRPAALGPLSTHSLMHNRNAAGSQ
jgi:hypothetical protein